MKFRFIGLLAGLTICLAALPVAAATAAPSTPSDLEAQSKALERATNAVVGVQTLAVADARSNSTLGRVRQGSGVVISADGLILTIGYLILEADQVQLLLDDGRHMPARVVGYDLATGFGLLQALAPLAIREAPLGTSRSVSSDESLLVVSGQPAGQLSAARMVSRRPFAGYWEYRIDDALFTAPARTDHSGAALFNARGELVGIGSLVVSNALGSEAAPQAGNMFVPVDLLRPILAELRSKGASAASQRAWLGISGVDQGGQVRVMRVAEDSPAEAAGVQAGDRIMAIDGQPVSTLDALWTRLWNGAPERDVSLEIERGEQRQTVNVRTVDRNRQLKKATGV